MNLMRKHNIEAGFMIEKNEIISDNTGFKMTLKEINLGDVEIKWGEYINPSEKLMTFRQDRESVVSHFQLHGSESNPNNWGLAEKQFLVYRESIQSYEHRITPTKKTPRFFFELVMSNRFFDGLISEESDFLKRFEGYRQVNTFPVDFIANITPQMYGVINAMQNAPYKGNLKGIFLEAKLLELFLMQVDQLDSKNGSTLSGISGKDADCLHYIKEYLDLHYSEGLSIISLSKRAGINQTKLKTGFKNLFKTTVFGYITDLRLTEAKRLLLEEDMYVNEVAYKVGFSYPHHFSAQFKRKFGISPAMLKS